VTRSKIQPWLAATFLVAASQAGCGGQAGPSGTFDRAFSANGPVRLELTNGSGDSRVTAGPAGQVRIHAEFQVRDWPWQSASRRLSQVQSTPPVVQDGNLIRVGVFGSRGSNDVRVNYTIVAPAETEIRGLAGSGDILLGGIKGPADLLTGSGNISASAVPAGLRARAGSGNVKLKDMEGPVQVTTGSGDIEINSAKAEVRVRAGSAHVRIEHPRDSVTVSTGSGDITIAGVTRDLRLHTGSGDITVDGDPAATNYWDLHANSGDVEMHVRSTASFRLYARSRSGHIDAAIPVVREGPFGRHELQGRIGDGKARVEIETSSGDISLH
jgi:putative adhesin